MSVQRLSHIGICVSQLERSVSFYTQALGFTQLSSLHVKGPEAAKLLTLENVELDAVYLERDGTRIELLHYSSPGHEGESATEPMNRLGFTHLSLRVDDLASALQSIRAHGGTVLKNTAIENERWGTQAVFATDPDGIRIELIEAPGDPNALPGA